jgi:hypothetical protein
MNAPLLALTRLLSNAGRPRDWRQRMIAARRFDRVSLTREEFAALPSDAQEDYRHQVRAACPRLYDETPADMARRWRDNARRLRDRDAQADHRTAIRDGERWIGDAPE